LRAIVLDLLSSGLISLGLPMMGVETQSLETFTLLASGAGWTLPAPPDSELATTIDGYLQQLEAQGKPATEQGIWLQSGVQTLADRAGTTPRPAASITKIATSLAALKTWKSDRQFETLISARGTVENGVVRGDLVVSGGSDPLFVWKEAIAVGNALDRMGIRHVTGDLIVEGSFAMNFESDPQTAGQLFKEAIDAQLWSPEAQAEYEELPPETPKPGVKIEGTVKTNQATSDRPSLFHRSPATVPLLRHQSLPLARLLKEMNVHSNNEMAQMLADAVGGAAVVAQTAAREAGVPPEEIQLINGSGLGEENRISPRAACAMFVAIQRHLLPLGLNIGDVFPVMGRDVGTLEDRQMPQASAVKTGTLNNVSALVGVLPTRDRGLVWFAIVNGGGDYVENFRTRQDTLLQTLQQQWGGKPLFFPPLATTPTSTFETDRNRLGAIDRNQLLWGG
jgi:serine-type D-Ala-D-Ala carboxypeptidase/endopeptidase (penicillin-binding protein 4)